MSPSRLAPSRDARLVLLTGAGISAESGVRTFRDGDGLWERHRLEDVATPEAFRRDPDLSTVSTTSGGGAWPPSSPTLPTAPSSSSRPPGRESCYWSPRTWMTSMPGRGQSAWSTCMASC